MPGRPKLRSAKRLRDGWLQGTCTLPERPCLRLHHCVIQSNACFLMPCTNKQMHRLEKIKYIKENNSTLGHACQGNWQGDLHQLSEMCTLSIYCMQALYRYCTIILMTKVLNYIIIHTGTVNSNVLAQFARQALRLIIMYSW